MITPIRDTEELQKMIAMRKAGMSYAAIGNLHGVSRQRIHQILSRTYSGYKDMVWERAGGCCEICGLPEDQHSRHLTYHHIESTAKGYNKPANLLLVCEPCHQRLHWAGVPDALIKKLWKIKGDGTFAEMAKNIKDLSEDGLRRIMQGNRRGRLETWQRIFMAYPELIL